MISTANFSNSASISPDWRKPIAVFAGLVILLSIANFAALSGMMRVWYETATYQHGFIVAPVAAWLIWRRREALGGFAPSGSWSALIPLAGFCALAMLGGLGGIALFEHVGFTGALMALFPFVFGWQVARTLWFPILFLGFMVPVGDFLIPPLQELTADASVWLIQMTGVPVFRQGLWIELPTGLWEVAEACAGLRFLIANIFVATVFAYLSYDKAWKWGVFAVLAVAIPVGANCLRAYGIMMLAHVTDNALAVGVDHLVYGWVFFSFVMLIMLWVGGRFADRKLEDPATPRFVSSNTDQRALGIVPMALAATLLIAPSAATALTAPTPAPLPEQLIQHIIPQGWSVVKTDPNAADRWTPRFDGADRTESVLLTDGLHYVDLFIAGYTHQREGAEALHWANRFDDDIIWKRSRLAGITLSPDSASLPSSARLDELVYTERGDFGVRFATRLVASWAIIGDTITASGKAAKFAEIDTRLSGGSSQAGVIALSASYGPPEYRKNAIAAIEALRAALPSLAALLKAER